MKYWEKDYTKIVDADSNKNVTYEDIYQESYNAHVATLKTSQQSSPLNLTHVDGTGRANMVDVGDKNVTLRSAKAVAYIDIGADAYKLVSDNAMKKGDVLSVAQGPRK